MSFESIMLCISCQTVYCPGGTDISLIRQTKAKCELVMCIPTKSGTMSILLHSTINQDSKLLAKNSSEDIFRATTKWIWMQTTNYRFLRHRDNQFLSAQGGSFDISFLNYCSLLSRKENHFSVDYHKKFN